MPTDREWKRRLPVGAEPAPGGGVHFRVWAPGRRRVEVVLEGGPGGRPGGEPPAHLLEPEPRGYCSATVAAAGPGTRYRYRLDGRERYPDPASRWQPEGPHGPSEVVDPAAYAWGDGAWRGPPPRGAVLYELHVGTFTPEGTYAAAARELPRLAELGVTCLEVMPVSEFAGRFGWGYDGVDLFAPTRLYGPPDALRALVDRAHALGLGVILDVVYNHLGPSGNYLKPFSPAYFTDRYKNEWGEALNFDGPDSGPVRELVLANAGYWVDEFHFDGLRLDATQQIFDASERHLLAELTARVRQAARGRSTLVVGENEPQQVRLLRPPEQGGYGLDLLWNDDFHHTAKVAATGRTEAYYSDYDGLPQSLLSAVKWGFLYQGQHYAWQGKRRGTPALDLEPDRLVSYLQNHDQVANSAKGQRLAQQTSPGRLRALTALWLLAPQTPMLFQGQEFAASAPFLYFADHEPELARLVRKGRGEFLAQFPSVASEEVAGCLPDPGAEDTFARCKLDHAERERPGHAEVYALHQDLLALRRDAPRPGPRGVDGAVLSPDALLLRYFDEAGDRLLLVNLGHDLELTRAPEPLLAPPEGRAWRQRLSTEAPRYGGCGNPPVERDGRWRLPAECAVFLTAEPEEA